MFIGLMKNALKRIRCIRNNTKCIGPNVYRTNEKCTEKDKMYSNMICY